MAAGVSRKISAASARAHTRRPKQGTPFQLPSGMFKKILVVFFMGFMAWAYQAIQPPPPKICGSADGPPVTAPRIKLSDGRHLAYKEHGVPKDKAKYKIVYVHGFDSCRHDAVIATSLSPDIIEGLGVYIVSFDRPGYGESDPNPKRTLKSMALDIEELADQLGLGSKFYVAGFSMGGQYLWTCLKYIPHRLAGATLIAPVINYWWPGIPANLSKEAHDQQFPSDRWSNRVAHYIPWLTYWWNTQKWFPACSVIAHSPAILSRQDLELLPRLASRKQYEPQVRQQGEFESLHRDLMIGFGTWEFDPMNLENPFPNNEGLFHIWHGDEDVLVPVSLQRYIAQQVPWINYHELPGAGHMFPHADGMVNAIVKALLIGENSHP
ncbi:Lysophospholipase BODYGUARD 2 precursor [Actinidia chinensis var. chinensis]|uniref:Lysophospholipase BODYGUARD 2 n=1 Tax=Actinidia chinensis var. chinensis TaxID=1590841 RepID=A0A2R6Q3D7_ACTCC|nr:Lysophospholipase BODYGUARD 2 precursor [Actinidia chinensis var. chinensis]